MRALALTWVLHACSVSLGIEDERFQCDSDADCAIGFICSDERVCAPPGPTGPCDIENMFDSAEWERTGTDPTTDQVQLTADAPNQLGALLLRRRRPTTAFRVEIDFRITGTAGSGLAFVWVKDDAPGRIGRNLGAYGRDGFVVEVDTVQDAAADIVEPHIAFARTIGSDVDRSMLLAQSPIERPQENTLAVQVRQGEVEVTLDDRWVLTATVPETFDAKMGVTAATGEVRGDAHWIDGFRLECM